MNQEPESEKSEVLDMSDADFERLLGDAYAAPPVPKSLLKRFDQAVSEQWGDLPSVVRSKPNRLSSVSGRVARSWKSWPVAACVALALVLAVIFRSDAHAYSWAAVVNALSKQPVVRLGVAGTAESE